jgi:hypothetical protein
MSTITEQDYARIEEPCKSCDTGVYASGSGKYKEVYCTAKSARLMGEGHPTWYKISDCPKLPIST